MELSRVQSPAVSSIPRTAPLEKPFLCGPTILKLVGQNRTCPDARKLRFIDSRARASDTTIIKCQAQDTVPSSSSQKDGNLVFVAGATGRVGSRTVRELLKLGFNVRAGVRSVQRAGSLVQSIENMKLEVVADGTKPMDKFELVECDLEKPEHIRPGIGNSSIVICCIGASEKEIFDITGPYRIDYQATKNLIDAATSAKVEHFILLTSLGTNKVGFPAAILNLFWGVLIWKRKAEEALLASGLPYTIVRPGGMERPTDSYKETHNLTLSEEDTLFGGLVSNLQVAELMAFMAKNKSHSCYKVVEVIAETSAPLTPMGDLLKKIPASRLFDYKESDDLDGSKSFVKDSLLTEKKAEQIIATKAAPQSPFTAYENLKPPTPPTPTPSTGPGPTSLSIVVDSISSKLSNISIDNVGTNKAAPKKKHASSPYINYEDLKPPSSPTPTPSGSKKEFFTASISSEVTVGNNNVVKSESTDVGKEHTKTPAYRLSPYLAYEDLKPPSSPTPTPSGSKNESFNASIPSEVTVGNNDVVKSESTNVGKEHTKTSAYRLSPYLAYEDLKPPSSPSPSVPKY